MGWLVFASFTLSPHPHPNSCIFPLTGVFGLLRVCSVCRAASRLHRVHLSSGSWDQGEILWGDRRRLQEGTEKSEPWRRDRTSAAQNVHRCLKQQLRVYAVYLCVCISQYFKCQVFIYIYSFRGYDNWERWRKGGHLLHKISCFHYVNIRATYTEVTYDMMFLLYGLVFIHYVNIYCSITTWCLIWLKSILDHITIGMQKGVAFVSLTLPSCLPSSMPCHCLFTARFWCPRVAKKHSYCWFPTKHALKKLQLWN